MIPDTVQMVPRPIYKRLSMRRRGLEPGPPTEHETRDAIRILEEGGFPDAVYREAERLMAEWGER